jgi:hypothetical protein
MEHVFLTAAGVAQLAVAWMCWSGRWRAWTDMAVLPLAPITALPAVGLLFIAMGLGPLLPSAARGVLYAVTFVALLAAAVIWMWSPSWYGPEWYRSSRPRPEQNGRPPS